MTTASPIANSQNHITMAWTSIRCDSAAEALDIVGAGTGTGASSTISWMIGANDGTAWINNEANTYKDGVPAIACQGNFTHVWKNLQERYPNTVTDVTLVANKKSVTHLLKHRDGYYIAIGEVMGAFRLWAVWPRIKDVPVPIRDDILSLVSDLWIGETYR